MVMQFPEILQRLQVSSVVAVVHELRSIGHGRFRLARRAKRPFRLTLLDRAPESEGIDLKAVRLYRPRRVRDQMALSGVDAVILSDPINIRYATGARNMQIFSQRNAPSRYLLLTSDRSILFEFTGCMHLADAYETIDEVRPSKTASFVAADPRIEDREREWAVHLRKRCFGERKHSFPENRA